MASATASKRAESKAPGPKHNIEAMRQAYYERIAKHDMTPLWKVMKNVVTKEPVTRCAPVVWHYDDIKRLVMESGALITAEEAERRVLILENPGMRGESKATNTLFAGVQMILPGEVAPAHRHVSSAIRFVLDGDGAYTAVEGEKAYMSPGDFVITANWAPHDHGNTSKKPMLWLDVLDFPQVNFFETSFAEQFATATQPTSRADGDSLSFYASGVLPDGAPAALNRSPVINYTYARTRPIIERMMKAGDVDKCHGARVRYANPINGGPCCRPWARTSPCSPRASRARNTARPTAPFSSAPKGRAPPRSTARCWNGAPTTCSWCRRGSITPTGRGRNPCCSRSPTARRRKRSESGARTPARTSRSRPRSFFAILMTGGKLARGVSFPRAHANNRGEHRSV